MTFRKAIEPDVEANMLAIPRKQRAMVRKGIKRGLVERDRRRRGPFLRAVCRQRASARNAAVSEDAISRRCSGLRRRCEVMTVVTRTGRRCRACCRSTFAMKCCRTTPVTIADGARARGQRLQVLGADAACVRTRLSGVRLRPLQARHRLVRLQEELGLRAAAACTTNTSFSSGDSIPQNNPSNPKYRAVDRLWRRLPRTVVNAIGPSIVRNLG